MNAAADDPALGAPVEYIDLRGTTREKPATCKYTGNTYYSEVQLCSVMGVHHDVVVLAKMCSCRPSSCDGSGMNSVNSACTGLEVPWQACALRDSSNFNLEHRTR